MYEELTFRYSDVTWQLGREAVVMGILNVTPDSFSDGGAYNCLDGAVKHGIDMVGQGASIIDIGGESTRPGATSVTVDREIERTVPVIEELAKQVQVPLSIDTQKAAVAEAALAAGAVIVNDISGLQRDPDMIHVLADSRAGCIVMHMRGTPETMQQFTYYHDLVGEICDYFRKLLARLEKAGVAPERVILDPGIGFSKTAEQNLELIGAMSVFRRLGRPVLAGPSRKSFIGKLLGIEDPTERLWGTAGAVAACALNGADLVRVHDVKEMTQVIKITSAIRNQAIG